MRRARSRVHSFPRTGGSQRCARRICLPRRSKSSSTLDLLAPSPERRELELDVEREATERAHALRSEIVRDRYLRKKADDAELVRRDLAHAVTLVRAALAEPP